MTSEEQRALVATALAERADELDAAGVRLGRDEGSPLIGAAFKAAAEHIRAYIEHRLPLEYYEEA